MPDEPEVTFYNASVQDTTVKVSPTGPVSAKLVNANALIIAKATYHGVTRADTARIKVTNTSPIPVIGTISIQPVPPDSARLAAADNSFLPIALTKRITPVITKASGGTIAASQFMLDYSSSDPSVATISQTGTATMVRPGRVVFRVTTRSYNVDQSDSLVFTVTNPVVAQVMIDSSVPRDGARTRIFRPEVMMIAPGGTVCWVNVAANDSIDIVFDDSTKVDPPASQTLYSDLTGLGGNIPPWAPSKFNATTFDIDFVNAGRSRTFRTPGTYHYHSTRYPVSGTIIVQ
jgi:plastocyanin